MQRQIFFHIKRQKNRDRPYLMLTQQVKVLPVSQRHSLLTTPLQFIQHLRRLEPVLHMNPEETLHDPLKFQENILFEHEAVQPLQRDTQNVLKSVKHRRFHMGAAGRITAVALAPSPPVIPGSCPAPGASVGAVTAQHASRLKGQRIQIFRLSAGNALEYLHADAVILKNLQFINASDERKRHLAFFHGREGHKKQIQNVSLVHSFHGKIFRQLCEIRAVINVFQVFLQMGKIVLSVGRIQIIEPSPLSDHKFTVDKGLGHAKKRVIRLAAPSGKYLNLPSFLRQYGQTSVIFSDGIHG